MLDVLARHSGEAGIVYCTSRKEVDALSAWLVDEGIRALPYHAGLSTEDRTRAQEAFLTEQVESSSRRSRSGWASIGPTCDSCSTPARRSRSSTTSRSRVAQAATGSRPSAC